jgi:multidrug efflux pump subunit AcrA (membrane-fusion protein)
MNNLKLLPLFLILFAPLGCSEDTTAAIDVVKKRITDQIYGLIDKGDIAIQKYENKIHQVRDNLIKVKVARNTFERKLEARQISLASQQQAGVSQAKIHLLKNLIQEMETFLQQVYDAETKLEKTLKRMLENLDLVKIKVAALEAKRSMLDALRTIQEYTNIEGDVDGIGMDNTLEQMQKDIDAIEAEIEISNFLSQKASDL